MPEFVYAGAHDAVDLTGHGVVERGQSVTVGDERAEEFRARDDWREVKAAAKRAAAKRAAAKRAAAKSKES